MNILSLQSHVAYGHVGNAAAVFPMQRLGHEVWPVHTVQFSNHPGYGAWRGETFSASLIDACVEGIAARGAFPRCDAVLSGYLGALDTGAAVLRAVARVKDANRAALYCCDPVIGDTGPGIFVRDGVADFYVREALGLADIITPNHFEMEILAGIAVRDVDALRTALATLHRAGPAIVLVTSLALDDTPVDAIDLAVSNGAALWRLRTPKLPLAANGAGDAIAALFLVHYLTTRDPAAALGAAASSIYGVLARTAAAGSRELLIIEAQDEFVAPSRRFNAVHVT